MKGSTFKRCSCKDPATGREIGRECPDLAKKGHGTWGYSVRLETSTKRRELRRLGFARKTGKDSAEAALDHVGDLVKLAGADDKTRQKIGDLIFDKTRRGGELPSVDEVRRRLGLGRALDASETFGEAWDAYLKGKRKARPSYANSLEQIGRNWLLPVLADVPIDRVNGELCAAVFERIDMFNEEYLAAKEAGRRPVLPGDVRLQAKHTGIATQHRIYAALRGFLNHCWKKRNVITFNPVYAVELDPEVRDAPLVWSPEQVGQFLTFHANDRLIAMWRCCSAASGAASWPVCVMRTSTPTPAR